MRYFPSPLTKAASEIIVQARQQTSSRGILNRILYLTIQYRGKNDNSRMFGE